MRGEQVLHVVPSADGYHVLYTRDGRVITINPNDGKVVRTAVLPAAIENPAQAYKSSSAQITPG
jgi:hypothetical protein